MGSTASGGARQPSWPLGVAARGEHVNLVPDTSGLAVAGAPSRVVWPLRQMYPIHFLHHHHHTTLYGGQSTLAPENASGFLVQWLAFLVVPGTYRAYSSQGSTSQHKPAQANSVLQVAALLPAHLCPYTLLVFPPVSLHSAGILLHYCISPLPIANCLLPGGGPRSGEWSVLAWFSVVSDHGLGTEMGG